MLRDGGTIFGLRTDSLKTVGLATCPGMVAFGVATEGLDKVGTSIKGGTHSIFTYQEIKPGPDARPVRRSSIVHSAVH